MECYDARRNAGHLYKNFVAAMVKSSQQAMTNTAYAAARKEFPKPCRISFSSIIPPWRKHGPPIRRDSATKHAGEKSTQKPQSISVHRSFSRCIPPWRKHGPPTRQGSATKHAGEQSTQKTQSILCVKSSQRRHRHAFQQSAPRKAQHRNHKAVLH